jgi:hypothetical protein
LLGALPRSYQVTPDIPDRRRATQRKPVRPHGRQRESESARRRSRSLHLASDVADEPDPNSKRDGSTEPGDEPRLLLWTMTGSASRAATPITSFAQVSER